ncbi:MAG: sarcosine oxidase subunit gamma [Alsobacter sp.]
MPYSPTIRAAPARPMIAVEAGPSDLGAVAGALGAVLPDCGASVTAVGGTLHRFGPVSLLWIGAPDAPAPDPSVLDATPAAGARIICDVSDAHGWIDLSGRDALSVLAQGVALDLRAGAFPPGTAVRTLAFGVEVMLRRTAPDSFAIACRASYHDFLLARLRLAADPAGEAR